MPNPFGIRAAVAATFGIATVLLATVFLPGAAGAQQLACCGGTISIAPGSVLDLGTTGLGHGQDIGSGFSIGFDIVRRCTGDQSPCSSNGDCGSDQCALTCNCASDSTCEIAGPTNDRLCRTTYESCTTNADCDGSVCLAPFGPPLPLNAGGTPLCLSSFLGRDIEGTFDSGTGGLSVSLGLEARVYIGVSLEQPCPRCGLPEQDPEVGDEFTCSGGTSSGAPCTVDAVTELYGGTSFDCPPDPGTNISGDGLTIPISELTTGTETRTAALPCGAVGFTRSPLNPGSMPKCTDKATSQDPVCTSNADCLRCSGDPTIACTTNTECTGAGSCAAAPEQPVTCGFWCHCGFCDDDPASPCFEDADCAEGETCEVGTGSSSQPNAPQARPNFCSQDAFICGMASTEECAESEIGRCSLESYRSCFDDAACEQAGAGTCVFEPLSCFEPRISRTGEPSPLGGYCETGRDACTTNADCTVSDRCVPDSAVPEAVAVVCAPAAPSGTLNLVFGGTGPAALDLRTTIEVSRCEPIAGTCGNSIVEGSEQCDDGNATFTPGEYCGDACVRIPCGKPTDSSGELPKSSDALFTLRAAVQQVECDPRVCDADGNGSVLASDAQRILRAAVALEVELLCPE